MMECYVPPLFSLISYFASDLLMLKLRLSWGVGTAVSELQLLSPGPGHRICVRHCCCSVAKSCLTLPNPTDWGTPRAATEHITLRLCRCSCDRLFVTPWTAARQAPLSMGFSRQEHWHGLPCPPPGDLSDPEIKPAPPSSSHRAFEWIKKKQSSF